MVVIFTADPLKLKTKMQFSRDVLKADFRDGLKELDGELMITEAWSMFINTE